MQYRARITRQTGIALVSLEQKSNNKRMLVAVASGSGQMKKMLCFAKHSMEKDMCLYRRPNIVDETIGSTDIGMELASGTDCDLPLATEATCSRCRC